MEREPQGGRRRGGKEGRQGAQEGAALVQVVWRNEIKNKKANDSVAKDSKRYVLIKHINSKLHCLRSGPVQLNSNDEEKILREKTPKIKKAGKKIREEYRQWPK